MTGRKGSSRPGTPTGECQGPTLRKNKQAWRRACLHKRSPSTPFTTAVDFLPPRANNMHLNTVRRWGQTVGDLLDKRHSVGGRPQRRSVAASGLLCGVAAGQRRLLAGTLSRCTSRTCVYIYTYIYIYIYRHIYIYID